jgi:hypothetical protein
MGCDRLPDRNQNKCPVCERYRPGRHYRRVLISRHAAERGEEGLLRLAHA